jgi:tryptophan-rich sensory protein
MTLLTRPYVQLALWILAYLLISGLIGRIQAEDVDTWYRTLNKPSFNPPDLAFPIVWTILYTLMAIAGWKLSQARSSPEGKLCFTLFLIQSVVNWGWSLVFFKAHLLGLAFGWILVLIALVAVLILKSWDVQRTASFLLLPYLFWIGFASLLSGSIWIMN